jgi:two-component system NtrC family response regulator
VSTATRKLLIVEDDPGIQSQLRWCFEDYEVLQADNRAAAITELRRHEPPVVLQDLGLPPDDSGVEEGFATLKEILQLAPFTKVVVVTGHGDQSNAVKAVGLGAYDFYQKPVDVDTLQLIVQRAYQIYELEAENRRLSLQHNGSELLNGIIAGSDAMTKVCRMIE